jgi:membrane protease YdiL (CAAX protease family)
LIWKSATPFLAMAFALATYLVVRPFLGTHAWAKAWPLRHAIILLAAANALSEELIYRTALLNVAYKTVPDGIAAAISALIFGLAHIHGQAKGWVVVLGSTACGYVFAVSVIQTQGLFVAWLLHFVQGMFFMAAFAVASADGSWATTSAGNETI